MTLIQTRLEVLPVDGLCRSQLSCPLLTMHAPPCVILWYMTDYSVH